MELEKLIEELSSQKFDFQKMEFYDQEIYASALLRRALIYYNKLGSIKDKKEKQRLEKKLDSIMSDKIKSLNPSFDDSIINKMLSFVKRGICQYPIDIFVVLNGVFSKEGTYDDCGNLYKMKTFMLRGNGNYFNIFDELDFLIEFPFSFPTKVNLTNEQNMKLSKFICDNINNLLMPSNEKQIVKPTYELNTDKAFYGTRGITNAKIPGINIYLSKNYPNIALSILKGEECDIKMLVQKGDEIETYMFHQAFKDNAPIWYGERIEVPIWRLSEEAIKNERTQLKRKKKSI